MCVLLSLSARDAAGSMIFHHDNKQTSLETQETADAVILSKTQRGEGHQQSRQPLGWEWTEDILRRAASSDSSV